MSIQSSDNVSNIENALLIDYCSGRTVMLVSVIMVLLAIVMLLVPGQSIHASWGSLGVLVLLLQWLGLSSLAVLCMLSPKIKNLGLTSSTIVAFLIIQLMTLIVSEIAYQLTQYYVALWPMTPKRHDLFLLRNLAISVIISGVTLRYMYMQRLLQRQLEAKNEARIQALQARIHPHFLFNSMNTIAALLHIDADAAEKAVISLSAMYRAALESGAELVPLATEIELTRHYLSVEGLRLNDRLRVDWQIDPQALQTKIPSLIIQPLVENAVYHGIEPCVGGGEIRISIEQKDTVKIIISNPLPSDEDGPRQPGNQLALKNIRDRLAIAFGRQASLKSFQHGDTYRVELELPVSEKPAEGKQ